jgi:hypothetical protein
LTELPTLLVSQRKVERRLFKNKVLSLSASDKTHF